MKKMELLNTEAGNLLAWLLDRGGAYVCVLVHRHV